MVCFQSGGQSLTRVNCQEGALVVSHVTRSPSVSGFAISRPHDFGISSYVPLIKVLTSTMIVVSIIPSRIISKARVYLKDPFNTRDLLKRRTIAMAYVATFVADEVALTLREDIRMPDIITPLMCSSFLICQAQTHLAAPVLQKTCQS